MTESDAGPAGRTLGGIWVALATPLKSDGSFDAEGCRRLVRHVLADGAHGILALGSTGEVAALNKATRTAVIETVAGETRGRAPFLVGVAQTELNAAIAEIAIAAEAGAAGALVVPPFYSPIDQATTATFYRRLAAASHLPILVYNIPAFTKVVVAPATVAELAADGVIAGIKDRSRDFEYFEQVLARTADHPEFAVFTGTDTMLLASLAMGASGVIAMSANLAPSWGVRVYDAMRDGRWDDARRAQNALIELVLTLRAGVFPSGIKAALSLAGICGDTPALPLSPLPPADRERLAAGLARLGLVQREAAAIAEHPDGTAQPAGVPY
ncbi:MAG TPA: dihydrodipicolinate synthase family protein [Thermomicrobiales bacterium]|nr:dihydrodipicolinate synthase family protein [Thermomicrobiales bacterium]